MRIYYFACLLWGVQFVQAQTGPGGKGTTDGNSNLVLWLRADSGVLNAGALPAANGETVVTWQDQSGNNYHALGANSPVFTSANASFASMPTITLVEGDDDYLFIEDDADEAPELDNTDELSVFFVFNSDNSSGTRALLSKRDGVNNEQSYLFYEAGNINSRINSNNDAGSAITGGTTYINSLTYQSGDFNHWLNQASGGGISGGTATIPNNNSDLNIGEFHLGDGRTFDGNFAEIIIFREYLTNAERIVVESYLASKYGISLTSDFWNEATYASYDNEIAGIGQHTDGSVAASATSAVFTISGGDDRGNGEWLFWGHNNGDFSAYTTTEVVAGSNQQRLGREWVVNETGEMGNVTVSVSAASLPATGLAIPNFYLLVDTDGNANFTNATSYPMTLNGANYEVTLDLDEGQHMAIAFEAPVPAGVSGSLAFWFDASSGVENGGSPATDGQSVTVWQDLSANNADAQNGTPPAYTETNSMNFHPVVTFDRASSEYLEFDLGGLDLADYTLMAVVQRNSATGSQYILGSENNATDALLVGYSANTQVDARNASSASVSSAVNGFDDPTTSPAIVAVNYNSSNLSIEEYRNGTIATGSFATSTDYAATGYAGNLGRALSGNYFDGDMAEVVAFPSNLSTTDYNALITNLAIQYGVTLGTDYVDEQANVLWDFSNNAGFVSGVAAIGFDDSFSIDQRVSVGTADEVILSTAADFTSLNSSVSRPSLADGQFAFLSNDGGNIALSETYNALANSRVERVWRIREVGMPASIVVAIPAASVDVNVMLVSADPTFSTGVSEVSLSTSGGFVYASYDFSDGDYFTFINDASEIWYSYVSGNWNDPQSWTLDGAISALYVNPNSKVPAAGDSVVIKTGRNITMNVNNVDVTKLEILGVLDLGATSGHNFNYLEGNGTLRLSGVAGVDNYPMANDTLFYESLEGGTVEYYGSGVTVSSIRRYNNLIINLDNGSDVFLQLADSIYVNGNFTVQQGTFQMNNGSATEDLVIEIGGNAAVESTGNIRVGAANARHEFNLNGDFTNEGLSYFTNRTSQTTGSEANNGIIDFNLVSGSRDQTIELSNETRFYRIEINKGLDATYVADIQAANPAFFELYGYAAESHGTIAQLTENNNALGLVIGTVKLGTNVDVGALNTGGNYNVSEGAELWLDGGSAFKNGGTAIVVYGSVRVSAGTLTADINSGITSRGNGTLFMDGGIVTIRQFRTSVFGPTNQGGIVMTGGILNITGETNGGISNTYYPLNLTYSGNVFTVSGGTLTLSGANVKGGLFINSDPENINVSGGTFNFISNTTNTFLISSRAGFYNLDLSKASASGGDFRVGTGQSGPGGNDETVPDLPLEIINDLTVDNTAANGIVFDAQGNDLEITGSLNVTAGSTVDFSDMKVVIEQGGSSSLNIGLATALQLDSLVINKSNEYVIVNISNGPTPAVQVNEYLGVWSGNFDLGAFDIEALQGVELLDTLGQGGNTGKLLLNGASAQTIISDEGAVQNLEIDNANGVELIGALGVEGLLELNSGILDIGTYQLTVQNSIATSGTFSNTLMVQTDGNASDGGIQHYFDGTTADPGIINFPIGTNANSTIRYTPVQLDLAGISDDGFVSVRMSDTELQTVDLSELANNMLTYYWRVRHTGFSTLPNVESLLLQAVDFDDPDGGATPTGFNSNFVPGKVLDEVPFTRSQEAAANISGYTITFNEGGSGFTLENANYTAGDGTTDLFVGVPDIYYTVLGSRQNWNQQSKWTFNSDGTDDGNTGVPGVGDVAVIKNYGNSNANHYVNANSSITVAQVVFDNALGGWFPRIWVTDRSANLNLGPVSGTGEFFLEVVSTATPSFTGSTDLGEFVNNTGSIFNFLVDADNQTVNLPSNIPVYPNLRIEAGGGANDDDNRIMQTSVPTTVNGWVRLDRSSRLRVNHDLNIGDDLQITWQSNRRTTVEIGDDREVTLEIAGDLRLENGNGSQPSRFLVKNDNQNGYEHTVRVGGNIEIESGQAATAVFDLYNGVAPNNNAILELYGEGSHTLTNASPAVLTPDLYRIVMNKGADTTSVFSFSDDFNLNGPVNVVPQAIELQAGKLVLDDAGISLQLLDGNEFEIPEGTGLEVAQGTVTADNGTIILDGLLRINGGAVTLTDTDIEYSNTGFALINVTSGSFEVGNIIRRAITTSTGKLKYRQTGGTVLVASDDAPSYSPSRASFEVTNSGSEFTFTGGTFTIQRGITGDNNISMLLEPETYNVAGSTIQLGNANTPDYGANYFNLKTAIPLYNLTIFDDADDNFPPVRLVSLPLTVDGTLTISQNTGLLANGFDVTLNGDLDNEGLFQNLSANTILNAVASQSVSGTGTFDLYDLTKQNTGTAIIGQDLALLHDLYVQGGILNLQSQSISLLNDAYIESTVETNGGEGIVFNGVANQDLYGVANVPISVGVITTQNAAGIDIPDGNGYQFNITENLRLNGGVFNIGGALVTITRGGVLTEVSPFNINNMIQTNSSFTDNGFIQEFYGVDADTTIFFPIGELKYTPVQFNLDGGATQGDIRVRPANEQHPTIVDNTEPMTETEIVDQDNALSYYWIVVAEDLTNASGEAIFNYNHSDINVTAPYDTTHYISGRLLSNGVNWDKFDPTLFWGGTRTFRVPFSTATPSEITGDYTAGVGSSDGLNNDIEGAIPDEIAQYLSDFGGLGNYNDDPNWDPQGSSPVLSSGIGPVGAAITISGGDDVTLNLSNVRLYSTHLESGSVLRVPAGSLGNRLGTVTGTGTIVLTDTELLPTGEYSNFLACDGGVLQYSGSTTYNVLSGISQIRKVIFDGSGTRVMPNNALNVCDTLIVNGPTISLNTGQTYNIGDTDVDRLHLQSGSLTVSNGTVVNVSGDLIIEGGTLNGNTGTELQVSDDVSFTGGTLNWNNMRLILDGDDEQIISGDFTAANAIDRLRINNSSSVGVTLSGGDVEIDVLLTFIDGLVNTSAADLLTINAGGGYTGASSNSYVTGPMRKRSVAVSSSYEFPVGKAVRYAPVTVANVGTGGDDWTAEYFGTTNPYSNTSFDPLDPGSGKNALIRVQSTDRWEVTSAGSNSAQIRITYGIHNSFENEESIRVVWWDAAGDVRWENMGAIVTGTPSSGTVISEDVISFSTQQFALGYAPETIVPVDLIDFNAQYSNGAVRITWQTASEKNNDYFEVQRSLDGKTYETIAEIDGAGDSDELLAYSTIDASPYLGVSYYRLHQVDFDGTSETFPPKVVYNDLVQNGLDFRMVPNPTTGDAINFVLTTGDDHTPIFIRMTDVSGRIVINKSITPAELKLGGSLNPTIDMSPGVYFISAIQGEEVRIQKLIIRE